MKLSFATMIEAMMDASRGPFACDRIECSPETMAAFTDLCVAHLAYPVATAKPLTACAYCRRNWMDGDKTCRGCGAQMCPDNVKKKREDFQFMQAKVVVAPYSAGLRYNQMRFVNFRSPERSGSLYLEM